MRFVEFPNKTDNDLNQILILLNSFHEDIFSKIQIDVLDKLISINIMSITNDFIDLNEIELTDEIEFELETLLGTHYEKY